MNVMHVYEVLTKEFHISGPHDFASVEKVYLVVTPDDGMGAAIESVKRHVKSKVGVDSVTVRSVRLLGSDKVIVDGDLDAGLYFG